MDRKLALLGTAQVMKEIPGITSGVFNPDESTWETTPLLHLLLGLDYEVCIITSRARLGDHDQCWIPLVSKYFVPEYKTLRGAEDPGIVGAWQRAFRHYGLTPPVKGGDFDPESWPQWRYCAERQGVVISESTAVRRSPYRPVPSVL